MNDNFLKDTATVFTIHNIGYQGLFPASDLPLTNFGWDLFTPEGIEFYGKINFLKAGLISAEILNTVSYTYSREILTREYGFGLEGVLKRRIADLYGIINGIDYQEWNPSEDRFIPANYAQSDLRGKNICRLELFESLFNFSKRLSMKIPLIGMVGRLFDQKGIDLIINSIEELMTFDTALIILGKGDEIFQRKLMEISRKFKEKVSVTIGYNEQFAHKIYAGIDFFLMPSKYEPCGLGQLIALRYGSIPIARKTGGLADTIEDYNPLSQKGTGFLFDDYTPSALLCAVKRAFCIFKKKDKFKKIIINGMKKDFSWKKSAEKYIELYNLALEKKRVTH